MSETHPHIVSVSYRELTAFAAKIEATPPEGVLPTTAEEAALRLSHPDVRLDDQALLVAWNDDGRCLGFVGTMPVALNLGGQIVKATWLSGACVENDQRGRGIASAIVHRFGELCDTVVTGGSSPSALKALARGGYKVVALRRPTVVRLWPTHLLPGFLRTILASVVEMPWRRRRSLTIVDEPTTEMLNLLASGSRPPFKRSPELIRWMLNKPWFSPTRRIDALTRRYHFLMPEQTLDFRCFRGDGPSGQLASAFILSRSENGGVVRTKLVDAETVQRTARGSLAALAIAESLRLGAKSVTIDQEILQQSWWGRMLIRLNANRPEIYSYVTKNPHVERLLSSLTDAHTTDGDLPYW